MKSVLLAPGMFFAEGGIERIMRVYLRALAENRAEGESIGCVALNDSPRLDARLADYTGGAAVDFKGCGRSRAAFVRHAVGMASGARRIICGHIHQLPVAWLATRMHRSVPYYLVAHGIEVWRQFSALERIALRGAHRILCVSEYTRRQMLRFCPGLDPARLILLPNTLDPRLQHRGAVSASAPVAGAGPMVLSVARLSPDDAYKGIDTLIEAMPLVRREFPAARLRIVGGGGDLPRLQSVARSHGVVEAVEFSGLISDEELLAAYAKCDVFALPSRKEGFGLVYLEAMTHGKPCVGARARAIPEVVDESVGALADYGDIPGLAAALVDVLRHPRNTATIRQRAEYFDFPHFRQRLADALH